MRTLLTIVTTIGFFATALTFLSACRSAPIALQVAPCIKDNQQGLLIRWGTTDIEAQSIEGYSLDTRGALSQITGEDADTTTEVIAAVPHYRYCAAVEQLTKIFVKVQALHSPGTKARYIEYINPRTNVFLRAVWNPDLTTFQSRDMRAQYDSLMKLVEHD